MVQPSPPIFNKYFNQVPKQGRSNETELLEEILEEIISLNATPAYYIARESQDQVDNLLGEDAVKAFSRAFMVPIYVNKTTEFGGDSEIFSRIGLEIRDTTDLIISRRVFEKLIPVNLASRPREGDLVFIPVFNKMFEITFTEPDVNFYTLGKSAFKRYIYELKIEAFTYSQEKLETGIDEIDAVRQNNAYSFNLILTANSGSGGYVPGEIVYQGSSLTTATASAEVKSWNDKTLTLEIYAPMGAFATGANVIGSISQAIYSLNNYDDADITTLQEVSDNVDLETEGTVYLNDTEVDPIAGNPF